MSSPELFEIALDNPHTRQRDEKEEEEVVDYVELKQRLPNAMRTRLDRAKGSILATMPLLERQDVNLVQQMEEIVEEQMAEVQRYMDNTRVTTENLKQLITTVLDKGKEQLTSIRNTFLTAMQQRQMLIQRTLVQARQTVLEELAAHTGHSIEDVQTACQEATVWAAIDAVVGKQREKDPDQLRNRLADAQDAAVGMLYGYLSNMLKRAAPQPTCIGVPKREDLSLIVPASPPLPVG
jgi:hypothetical protein